MHGLCRSAAVPVCVLHLSHGCLRRLPKPRRRSICYIIPTPVLLLRAGTAGQTLRHSHTHYTRASPSIAAHFAAFFCAAPRRCGGFWRPLVAVFRCGWCAAACNCGVELWACGRQRPPRRWLPPSFSRSLPVPRCRRQPRRRSSQHSTHAHSSLFPTLYIRCVLP